MSRKRMQPFLISDHAAGQHRGIDEVEDAFEALRDMSAIYDPKYGFKIPSNRKECPRNRPCPWVLCRYHLYVDLTESSIRFNFPGATVEEMPATCVLDVARGGGCTLEGTGQLLGNLTKQRVQQIEQKIIANIQRQLAPKAA